MITTFRASIMLVMYAHVLLFLPHGPVDIILFGALFSPLLEETPRCCRVDFPFGKQPMQPIVSMLRTPSAVSQVMAECEGNVQTTASLIGC